MNQTQLGYFNTLTDVAAYMKAAQEKCRFPVNRGQGG